MKYLANENRIPYLLALVEITQFQHYVRDRNEDDDDEYESQNSSLFENIEFDPNLPKSQIVFMDEEELKEPEKYKANKLFEKYIAHGRYKNPLTIELASSDDIEDVMFTDEAQTENDIQEIIGLFDVACNDIWKILIKSFTRFRKTEQYQQFDSV